MRFGSIFLGLVVALAPLPAVAAPSLSFAEFLRGFEAKAVAAGVSAAVYERAVKGLTPDPRIPALQDRGGEHGQGMFCGQHPITELALDNRHIPCPQC